MNLKQGCFTTEPGRFIVPDPIGFAGGINLFSYVQNNPINWIDPFGKQIFNDTGTIYDDEDEKHYPGNINPDAPGSCGMPGYTEKDCKEYIRDLHKEKWWQFSSKLPGLGIPGTPPFIDPPLTVPDPNPWYCRYLPFLCSPKPDNTEGEGGNVSRGDPTFIQTSKNKGIQGTHKSNSDSEGLITDIEVPHESSLVRANVPIFGIGGIRNGLPVI